MAKQEPTLKVVKMDDGREVDFVGKRKVQKTPIETLDGKPAVRLDFINGEVRIFVLPDSLMQKFATHGAEQKLGDELAGVEDVEDCVIAIDSLMDRLSEGKWTATRESSGMAGTSILAKALVEHSGKPADTIRAFLATKSQAEKIALRGNSSIRPIVERLEAEKAARSKAGAGSSVDTESLLEQLV